MVSVEASGEVVDVVLVSEHPHFDQESQDLGSTYPAKVLLVDHLEAVHEVEVGLFDQVLFVLFELSLLQDHFEEHLYQVLFVLQV